MEVLVVFLIEAIEEVVHEEGDVLAAVAEGWEVDGDDVEAVVEVFAEVTFADFVFEVEVGGGDDAGVDLLGAVVADAFELAFLEDSEESDLKLWVEGSDFVEEDGSALGGLETACFIADSACEGAFDVAEKFGFEELGGECSAVDADEGFVSSWGVVVDGFGDEFLAAAGFAKDEDGGS